MQEDSLKLAARTAKSDFFLSLKVSNTKSVCKRIDKHKKVAKQDPFEK